MAPFPFPARQTGRADFPHPAFRLASSQGPQRGPDAPACLAQCSRLRLAIELSPTTPELIGHFEAHRQSAHVLVVFESAPEVRGLCSARVTRPQRSYAPVRLPPTPSPNAMLKPQPPNGTGLPRLPALPFQRAAPSLRAALSLQGLHKPSSIIRGRVEEGRGGLRLGQSLRLPSPLIKPDVRVSRIRLSDWLRRKAHGGGPRCVRLRSSTPSSP